jgi:hypothetical protein
MYRIHGLYYDKATKAYGYISKRIDGKDKAATEFRQLGSQYTGPRYDSTRLTLEENDDQGLYVGTVSRIELHC